MDRADHLPQAALDFLEDLGKHNDKAWYAKHKARAQADLVEPCKALIRDVTARLEKPFPHITGSDKGVGGSITRLHRDVRFSKDKSPYHTHVGMHFWHRDGKKMQVPGFFVRVAPEGVTVYTGLHGPDKPELERIRKSIDADPKAWKKAAHAAKFTQAWGGLTGESLKRVPKPWDADHPFADDLRRKDFIAGTDWKPGVATQKGFAKRLVDQWQASADLMAFLCGATGMRW